MNVKLQVEIVSHQGRNNAENYIHLEKLIDLPFAPTPELRIYLPPTDEEHPDYEKSQEVLEAANGDLATGIFEVRDVMFDLEIGEFIVQTKSPGTFDDSPEAIEMLAQQLVYVYGFERRDW